MDATTSERKSINLNRELKNDEDIISSLPDDIIHHILSFLRAKHAVATCVLSTRWKYLWRSLRNLDFSHDYYFLEDPSQRIERKKRLANFVDQMLLFHDMLDIHKFRYEFEDCDSYHLHSWISTLIRHNVQELILSLGMVDPIVFPSSVFSCESLTLLDIDVNNIDVDQREIEIPTLVFFPRLKILHIKSISFIRKELTHQVIFSCPILEELQFFDIQWQKISTVQIKTPRLESLDISDVENYSCVGHVDIEIYAESLISLELTSVFSYKYCLYNLFSLDVAVIDTFGYDNGEQYHYVDLLRGITNVKDLTLGLESIEIFSRLNLSAYLLTFSSLTHLSVFLTRDVDFHDNNTIGTKLIDVLCNTPNIEYLCFPRGTGDCPFEELGLTVETNPMSFLPHLEVIDFGCFAGEKNELCLIDFFLKNVGVLQKMNIDIHQRIEEVKRIEIARHLQQLARDSNGVLEYFL